MSTVGYVPGTECRPSQSRHGSTGSATQRLQSFEHGANDGQPGETGTNLQRLRVANERCSELGPIQRRRRRRVHAAAQRTQLAGRTAAHLPLASNCSPGGGCCGPVISPPLSRGSPDPAAPGLDPRGHAPPGLHLKAILIGDHYSTA